MKKRINPASLKRPNSEEVRRAAEVLIAQHLFFAGTPEGLMPGIQKSYIEGGPEVAIFTVSGWLIGLFDTMVKKVGDRDFEFSAVSTAIDVKPADSELVELRKIAGLPKQ